ncbi:MAG: phosphatidylserine/phosphatidylglycerophosphate/cardiolipin synthase family protein [Deltaproteobacteria bacterium]|nr:phosphatidylserine/phosphatidylglycerophosphate/cardiolipin synthase family protein [Deltaproteobacteria bacterium]
MDARPGRLERMLAELSRQTEGRSREGLERGALERAARWLGSAVGSVARAREALDFLKARGVDQVVGLGECVELEARLDPLRMRLGHEIRFHSGEREWGRATLDARGRARLVIETDEPGLFAIEAAIHTEGGTGLGEISGGVGRLLVMAEEPVLAVDSALLAAGVETPAALSTLRDAGVKLVFLCLSPSHSREHLDRELATERLTPAVVLGADHASEKLPTLGVDFRPVFARTLIRRMRASGVAVVGLLSADVSAMAKTKDLGVRLISAAGLGDADLAVRLRDAAGVFHERRRHAVSPLRFRLDQATATRAVEGNSCVIELDNHAARHAVLHAIDEARREILLSVYILEEGHFSDELSYSLVAAARRGVKVRALVDALYSRQDVLGVTNVLVAGLAAEPGIEILASRPILSLESLDPLLLKERDHRKLLVIDGERAFVSGRNAGDAYYTGFDEVPITDFTAHERIPWLDAHIELSGPLTREVAESFREAFREAGGADFELHEAPSPRGHACARLVIHHGVGDANAMAAYEAILDSARDHVFILNDFPVVDTLAAAVRRAVARGVDVTLLTGSALARRRDGSFFRGPLHREAFEYMTKERLLPLVEAGVNVIEVVSPPETRVLARGGIVRPYVHAKLMSADARVVSVGSANLDVTASYWEQEAIVVVEDEELTARVERELRALRSRGLRLDPEAPRFREEAPLRELASRLWPDSLYS